jgi:hypothetical protein
MPAALQGVVDVFEVLHLIITLATIAIGFTLLRWRERWVDSGWRWLIGQDERLRRPLEVLYVICGNSSHRARNLQSRTGLVNERRWGGWCGSRATAAPAWRAEQTRTILPTEIELDARGRGLRAALAAVLVADNTRELRQIHDWLDTWTGLGLIVAGMAQPGPRSSAHRVLRTRLAGELLPRRHRPLHRGWVGVGADAVAGGAAASREAVRRAPRYLRRPGVGALPRVTTPLLRQTDAPALGQLAGVDRVLQIEAVRLQEGPGGLRRVVRQHNPQFVMVHAAEPEQGSAESQRRHGLYASFPLTSMSSVQPQI